MKISSFFKTITIKQADIITVSVIFLCTMIFVGLLVEEMYEDYEKAIEQSYVISIESLSESELIAQKHQRLKSLLIKTALAIVTLSFILFAIFLGFHNLFNKLLHMDTKRFLKFFEQNTHSDYIIDPNKIFFQDFKIMVGYANEMVTKIKEQRDSLEELNQGLEERVKMKMTKLESINENLEKEKKFSQDLLKAQKEFLRYTVHETNTPLSVILMSIELYLMKNPRDRQLSKIEAAVKNIFSIYDDLSYLVKKDQVEYPKRAINFANYINARIDFFTEVAEQSKVSFNNKIQAKEMHIYFNETKLQRIVDNTITNAIKYTLPKEVVTVTLMQIGANIEFAMGSKAKTIKDTQKVFHEYYREEEKADGFGIGLGLVRSICEEENIKISVSSDAHETVFKYVFKMMGD
ncbi:MAG: HAMP domain-containing histidine kinase [Sulfurimonas sp.]|uniref:sensor histidine kinase n=1 Tax=Sulfurimonas sp. TaxID=2022749 RepID=UPI0025F30910|nr:HAMP domain-containing sensor histidine kinase [Sulfurimonas sp.]MCK9491513.1 HAMP domain-containing histidine kinase [Sulfurimonas sp.]